MHRLTIEIATTSSEALGLQGKERELATKVTFSGCWWLLSGEERWTVVGDSHYSGGNGHVCKRYLELNEPFGREMKKKEKAATVVLAKGNEKLLGMVADWSSCRCEE